MATAERAVFPTIRRPLSEGLLFGAGDDFVVQLGAEVDEVVAVARHADDQVAAPPWMFLGLARAGSDLGRPSLLLTIPFIGNRNIVDLHSQNLLVSQSLVGVLNEDAPLAVRVLVHEVKVAEDVSEPHSPEVGVQ